MTSDSFDPEAAWRNRTTQPKQSTPSECVTAIASVTQYDPWHNPRPAQASRGDAKRWSADSVPALRPTLREIDRLILTDVEIEMAENVVEMIAHEPRRALHFAVPERAHEGDMFIMTTGRGVTTSVEGDHQRRSRDQASQEGGKNAFSGRRRDGDVKGSG